MHNAAVQAAVRAPADARPCRCHAKHRVSQTPLAAGGTSFCSPPPLLWPCPGELAVKHLQLCFSWGPAAILQHQAITTVEWSMSITQPAQEVVFQPISSIMPSNCRVASAEDVGPTAVAEVPASAAAPTVEAPQAQSAPATQKYEDVDFELTVPQSFKELDLMPQKEGGLPTQRLLSCNQLQGLLNTWSTCGRMHRSSTRSPCLSAALHGMLPLLARSLCTQPAGVHTTTVWVAA